MFLSSIATVLGVSADVEVVHTPAAVQVADLTRPVEAELSSSKSSRESASLPFKTDFKGFIILAEAPPPTLRKHLLVAAVTLSPVIPVVPPES